MTMPVFIDDNWNRELAVKGYVKIPFLENTQIEALLDFYNDLHRQTSAPFTTFMNGSYAYRKQVDEQIKNVFERNIKNLFFGYQPLWGNFFTKPSAAPQMELHADLQYVNESKFISLNIWVPLMPTEFNSATLGVVPGSHRVIKQIRGINITDAYRRHAKEIAEKYVEWLSFKAGEAIVYDHRLLHCSSANNTAQTRVAATLVMVPCDAPLHIYIAQNEGDTTFYKFPIPSADDLLRYTSDEPPANWSPIETVHNYVFEPLSLDMFTYHNPVEC